MAEIEGETYVILGPGQHVAEVPSDASELVSTEHVEWYRRPLDGTGPDFTFVPRYPSRRLGPTSVSGGPIVELIRFCPSQLRGTELSERRLAELYDGVYPSSGMSWRAAAPWGDRRWTSRHGVQFCSRQSLEA